MPTYNSFVGLNFFDFSADPVEVQANKTTLHIGADGTPKFYRDDGGGGAEEIPFGTLKTYQYNNNANVVTNLSSGLDVDFLNGASDIIAIGQDISTNFPSILPQANQKNVIIGNDIIGTRSLSGYISGTQVSVVGNAIRFGSRYGQGSQAIFGNDLNLNSPYLYNFALFGNNITVNNPGFYIGSGDRLGIFGYDISIDSSATMTRTSVFGNGLALGIAGSYSNFNNAVVVGSNLVLTGSYPNSVIMGVNGVGLSVDNSGLDSVSLRVGGAMKRITEGAIDSAGLGYKLLRVPN